MNGMDLESITSKWIAREFLIFTHLSAFLDFCVMSQCIGEFSLQNNTLHRFEILTVAFKELNPVTACIYRGSIDKMEKLC